MANEVVPLLHLMSTKGVGPRALARILERLRREQSTLRDLMKMDAEDLVEHYGLSSEQAAYLRGDQDAAQRLAEILEEHAIRTALRGDEFYPPRLESVLADKAPPVLFLAGSPELLSRRGMGFSGARNASEEGLRRTEELAAVLAGRGFLVVSGHAPGVDEAAHRAALEAGGATAFVLPEGILHFRPRPSLAEFMSEDRYVVIAEFPPKMPWSISNAMQRNRTICGLAEALIVVEAGQTGGTWEAGLEALKLGTPLFVLDFDDPPPSALGNASLIKKGGVPLRCRQGEAPEISPLEDAMNNSVTNQPKLF